MSEPALRLLEDDGTPEEIATALRAYAAEGITHLQVWLEPNTLAGLEAFAAVVEQLDKG